MIRIAVCDDDKETLLQNENRIKVYLKKMNMIAELETYQSSEFLQYDIQENKFFDLLLLDIKCPEKVGWRLHAKLKKYAHKH